MSFQNLPRECLENIIKFVREGREGPNSNLFSCILVNRSWRDSTLPSLWGRPFNDSTPISNGVKLINTYILSLSEEQKQYLEDNGIYLRQNSTSPTLNYSEYLRELKYEIFEQYTRFWFFKSYYNVDPSIDLEVTLDVEYSELENINNQIQILLSCLYSMFIRKSINLTCFSFYSCNELCLDLPEFSTSHPSATNNSNSLLRTLTTFICDISGDELYLPNLMNFMEILSRHCKVLKTIDFTWKNHCDMEVCEYLIDIISEQQLNEIRLNVDNVNIDEVIEVLIETQSHCLTRIQLENVNFSSSSCESFFNSLTEFYKLERLTLIDCQGLSLSETAIPSDIYISMI
jgi:hypothetical protein